MDEGIGDITRLLHDARDGRREAFDRLLPLVYDGLRAVAGRQMGVERKGHTLNPTALVHEAYMKLVGNAEVDWQSRAHFFSIGARAMRQILVDHARRRAAEKRGGGWRQTTLGDKDLGIEIPADELLALDTALDELGRLSERLRQIVEYRFFGGMTEKEVGAVLGMSDRTVRREWLKARAWLYKELYGDES